MFKINNVTCLVDRRAGEHFAQLRQYASGQLFRPQVFSQALRVVLDVALQMLELIVPRFVLPREHSHEFHRVLQVFICFRCLQPDFFLGLLEIRDDHGVGPEAAEIGRGINPVDFPCGMRRMLPVERLVQEELF